MVSAGASPSHSSRLFLTWRIFPDSMAALPHVLRQGSTKKRILQALFVFFGRENVSSIDPSYKARSPVAGISKKIEHGV